jgi:hypothetical protein
VAYEPLTGWLEWRSPHPTAGPIPAKFHVMRGCRLIAEGSESVGPLLYGEARRQAGKQMVMCRCTKGRGHAGEADRPRWQVSGGLPTLGRR